jgi:AcrR family transcriptional regulator
MRSNTGRSSSILIRLRRGEGPIRDRVANDREHLLRGLEYALVRRSSDHGEAALRDGRSLAPRFFDRKQRIVRTGQKQHRNPNVRKQRYQIATLEHSRACRTKKTALVAYVEEFGGAGHLTLREAARRANVSHSAPYRHFPDRQAILASVAAEGFAKLSRALRQARAGVADDEDRFVRTGLAYLRFARERRGYLAVMFGPEVAKSHTPELQQSANGAFTVLQEMAADARAIDVTQARRRGTVIWSFVHGLATLTGHNQVPSSVNETPEALATLGLRCLFWSFRSRRSRTPIATKNPTGQPAR